MAESVAGDRHDFPPWPAGRRFLPRTGNHPSRRFDPEFIGLTAMRRIGPRLATSVGGQLLRRRQTVAESLWAPLLSICFPAAIPPAGNRAPPTPASNPTLLPNCCARRRATIRRRPRLHPRSPRATIAPKTDRPSKQETNADNVDTNGDASVANNNALPINAVTETDKTHTDENQTQALSSEQAFLDGASTLDVVVQPLPIPLPFAANAHPVVGDNDPPPVPGEVLPSASLSQLGDIDGATDVPITAASLLSVAEAGDKPAETPTLLPSVNRADRTTDTAQKSPAASRRHAVAGAPANEARSQGAAVHDNDAGIKAVSVPVSPPAFAAAAAPVLATEAPVSFTGAKSIPGNGPAAARPIDPTPNTPAHGQSAALPANPSAAKAPVDPGLAATLAAVDGEFEISIETDATSHLLASAGGARGNFVLTDFDTATAPPADPKPVATKTPDIADPTIRADLSVRTASAPADAAAAAARSARTTAHPMVEQIAVQMTKAATDGTDRISIRLSPVELGRIDIRMEVGPSGHVQAVFAADRPHTLDLLQRDARELQRALQDAGLQTDSGSLSFNLRGDGRDGRPAWAETLKADSSPASLPAELPAAAAHVYGNAQRSDGRLDIRV
ncbi:MAG: flagellar hook-length control protein FliK [Rhodospirillales bacterium]|nr:flagellar hook-length control protein FliK [Rhodospirillales bacterium]